MTPAEYEIVDKALRLIDSSLNDETNYDLYRAIGLLDSLVIEYEAEQKK